MLSNTESEINENLPTLKKVRKLPLLLFHLSLILIFPCIHQTQVTRQGYPRKLGFFISLQCNDAEHFVSAGNCRQGTRRAGQRDYKVSGLVIPKPKTDIAALDLHPASL